MSIYATPFNTETKDATGPSTDSGFETLEQVVELMGPPVSLSPRVAVYAGVAYSDFVFRIDDPATTG